MDPLSIATSSAALAGLCLTLAKSLYAIIDDVKTVDSSVKVIAIQVSGLSKVLDAMNASFNDPSLAAAELTAQTGHEGQHWRNVMTSMEDCKETLTRIGQIVTNVSGIGGGFQSVRKMIRWNMYAGELRILQQQIQSYEATMHISLQMIDLSSRLTYQSNSLNLLPRLDILTKDISLIQLSLQKQRRYANQELHSQQPTTMAAAIFDSMVAGNPSRSEPQGVPEPLAIDMNVATRINSHVVENLENCMLSARSFISAASTIISQGPSSTATSESWRASIFGSEIGEGLSQERRNSINHWVTQGITSGDTQGGAVPNATPRSVSEALSGSQLTDDGSSYTETETRLMSASNSMMDISAEDPDSDIESGFIRNLRLSGKLSFERGDYAKAQQTMRVVLKRSEFRYGWNYGSRHKDLELLAFSLCNLCRWVEAESILLELLDSKTEVDEGMLNVIHALVKVQLQGKRDFQAARVSCEREARERKRLLGGNHPLFHNSVALLATISECLGYSTESEGYRAFLPPGFREEMVPMVKMIQSPSSISELGLSTKEQTQLKYFVNLMDPKNTGIIRAGVAVYVIGRSELPEPTLAVVSQKFVPGLIRR